MVNDKSCERTFIPWTAAMSVFKRLPYLSKIVHVIFVILNLNKISDIKLLSLDELIDLWRDVLNCVILCAMFSLSSTFVDCPAIRNGWPIKFCWEAYYTHVFFLACIGWVITWFYLF